MSDEWGFFMSTRRLCFVLLACVLLMQAQAFAKKVKKESESPTILLEEFELDERNVVMAATKTKKTIQESPSIITVITAAQIREQGHRTVNDILRTIPGFEGDRWELNRWFQESFSRGTFRGLLILINGVNVVDPVRNNLVLDFKIPVEMIKRIEVVSGPGGVLWGSNSLVGVVNIITKTGADVKNWVEGQVSFGDGAWHQYLQGSVLFGHVWKLGKYKLDVFTNISYRSFKGIKLTQDAQKLIGSLPPPSNEIATIYDPRPGSTIRHRRSWFVNWNGTVKYGPFSLEWMVPFEKEYREFSAGGSVLSLDYSKYPTITPITADPTKKDITNAGSDRVMYFAARYKDRFWASKFGINVTAFYVNWDLDEDPFGSFAYSSLVPAGIYSKFTTHRVDRVGITVDMDIVLPANNHLIFGGEFFRESLNNVTTTAYEPNKYEQDPKTPTLQNGCTPPYEYRPSADPVRPCNVTQPLIFDTNRLIGALFVTDEWKPISQLALNLGGRLQVSNTYSPAFLVSGGFVWNIWEKTYLKFNYAQGFRPPQFQATNVNSKAVNGITFSANPDLQVEKSQAWEVAINGKFFEHKGIIRGWYIRANYSYTLLSNLIGRSGGGQFINSGDRRIHSVEFLTRLRFRGSHEISLGYYFVNVEDSELGPIRQIANHILNASLKVNLWKKYLQLNLIATWRGAMEDRNRLVNTGTSSAYLPGNLDTQSLSSDITVDKINSVLLLRAGIRVRNFWKNHMEINAYFYNILNRKYADADFDFDSRVFARPYPKPTWSFLVQTVFRY